MKIKEVKVKRIVLVFSIIICAGLVWSPLSQAQVVQTPLDPAGIPKFVNNLPMLKFEPDKNGNWKGDIPVALGTAPITVSICEFKSQILPEGTIDTVTGLPVPTETWGLGLPDRRCLPAVPQALLHRACSRRQARHTDPDDLHQPARQLVEQQRLGLHSEHRPDHALGRPAQPRVQPVREKPVEVRRCARR